MYQVVKVWGTVRLVGSLVGDAIITAVMIFIVRAPTVPYVLDLQAEPF